MNSRRQLAGLHLTRARVAHEAPQAHVAPHTPITTRTTVELWVGTLHAPHCVADMLGEDVLTLSRPDGEHDVVVRVIPAGDWKTATVFSADGNPLYTLTATTPARKLERVL